MPASSVRLETPSVRAAVYPTGGLLTEAEFRLADGRWVKPLAEAPWAGEPLPPEVPGHLLRLGGEFFCLPFGGCGPSQDGVPGYEAMFEEPFDQPTHGPAGNAEWEVGAVTESSVTLTLDLPEPHAVSRVERTITLGADRSEIRFDMRIEARRKDRVPMAFHPILRLPEQPRRLKIEADFADGFNYPGVHPHRKTLATPGGRFRRLDAVPGHKGQTEDFSALPPGPTVEDNILLAGMRGPVTATFLDEGFRLVTDWDRSLLPHAMLWLHDRATEDAPWHGRYRGLGIEPMAACFDGPWRVSVGDNPLAAAGYRTAVDVDPARDTVLWCRLGVEATSA